MKEQLFPEISNWYRNNQRENDTVIREWVNYEVEQYLRVCHIQGPFGEHTDTHIVEVRNYPDDPESEWELMSEHDTVSGAKQQAYEYAQEHNDEHDSSSTNSSPKQTSENDE